MEKTKLIATLCDNDNVERQIEKFLEDGIDVIRINMSYSSQDDARKLLRLIDEANKKHDLHVATLIDLEGPCVRTGEFSSGKAEFKTDDKIKIYMNEIVGDNTVFSVNYPDLINDLKYKSFIRLSKGNVELEVIEKGLDYALCNVLKGGIVESNSKMYFPNIKINKKFLSEQDRSDVIFAHDMGVDFISTSSISSSEDVLEINDLLIELKNEHILLLAKIENKQAYEDLDNIIRVADGIILDRGDIGIELPIDMVPNVQKKIIKKCYENSKLSVITAEFGSFMEEKIVPNRAEVSDLSTLVSEAVDGIMLTSETTTGSHPIDTVKMVKTIVNSAEDNIDYSYFFKKSLDSDKEDIASTVSSSVVLGANNLECKAIIVATSGGNTARIMSQLKPPCPIIAAVESEEIVKSLQMCFGVLPVIATGDNLEEIIDKTIELIRDDLDLKSGDKIIATGGFPFKKVKHTNFMEIIEI